MSRHEHNPASEALSMTAQAPITPRQRWMAILARASAAELDSLLPPQQRPAFTVLKPAETGTVMVEARAGGTGDRFNLGEATATRCVVRLASGTMGFSYALGTDRAKAESAALIDALMQDAPDRLGPAIATLGEKQRAAHDLASRKAAATKVDFFTLVRGE
jgi:alpha-D-ribose 1-methylphosphonate 5-triphosphate synthase subunit PhnG